MANIDQNEVLHYIFNSKTKVKILKFLFRNYPGNFSAGDISKVAGAASSSARRELAKLVSTGLVRSKLGKSQGKEKSGTVRIYYLNPEFDFFDELRNLILKSSSLYQERMVRKILKLGRIKLIVASGVFLNIESPAATDLLIVGDDMDKRKFRIFLKNLESEVGKEINFAIMERDEFDYRRKMFDRFIRVLFEGPNKILLDRIGLSSQ